MFEKKKIAFAAAILLFFSSGCVHHSLSKHYRGPQPLPEATARYYSYESPPGELTIQTIVEKDRYILKRVELKAAIACDPPHAEKQEMITIDYYEAKSEYKTPVIIVLPILGGNNSESDLFARYFAEHGFSALMVHRDTKQKEKVNLETLEASLREMVIDHKLVIDWIERNSKLDATRIGVFGISMGGIKAALLTALDTRVRAAVIALAGGDIPSILIHSKEKGVEEKIAEIIKKNAVSKQDLFVILQKTIRTDPLLLAPYIDARKVLMISPIFDRVVPRANQRKLRRVIGKPETIDLLSGHYTAILYIPYVQNEALWFFQRKLRY